MSSSREKCVLYNLSEFDTNCFLRKSMRKILLENMDGRTRDEREACFPISQEKGQRKGAGTR